MKMKRHTNILRAGLLMLALAACGTTTTVQAQESHKKFTLTNGRLYWMDANTCDLDRKYDVAFDKNNSWAKCHVYGNQKVTHYAVQGEKYLALQLTPDNEHPTNPPTASLVAVNNVTGSFTPYCVWTRTGSTGYYYQEWGNYRYYLVGTPDELRVVQVEIGAALENATYWYDWDFGVAISNVSIRNGVRTETTHWIYYDTVGKAAGVKQGEWKMVPQDCYQRPEDVIYYNPADGATRGWTNDPAVDNLNRSWYWSYTLDATTTPNTPDAQGFYHDGKAHAYGNGALYLPVTEINHPTTIVSYDHTVGASTSLSTLRYGEAGDTADITLSLNRAVGATVQPAYTEYIEEKSRCGINLSYMERTTETFGKAGVPEEVRYVYVNGERTLNDAIPGVEHPSLTLASVTYSLAPRLRRFIHIYSEENSDPTIHDTVVTPPQNAPSSWTPEWHAASYSIPARDVTDTLWIYLKFSYEINGDTYYAFDTLDVRLTASSYVHHAEDRSPTTAPVIFGYVCGGGRMANVGWDNGNGTIDGGNTNITIHNTDTTYAVYGGNDIAGWVQGSATIQVGTLQTVTPLRLGYLYGGGCGYYSYENTYDAAHTTGTGWAGADNLSTTVGYGQYCFSGKVYPWHYQLQGTAADNDYVVADDFEYPPYVGDDFAHGETGQSAVTAGKMRGTVPYIKTAHITIGVPVGFGEGEAATDALARVHNDLVRLDTIFGGGENSFIGIDGQLGMDSRAVTLDVHGGTIMALFGGNNYGGSVAQKAHTYITVENTKLSPDAYTDDPAAVEEAIINTYYTGYGRDFGIRHLYGGGNMVESAHAQVHIKGGMIDTCFLGGNMASVVQPIGTIDCRGKGFIYKNYALPFLFAKKYNDNNELVNNPEYIDLRVATNTGNTAGWESVRQAFLHHNPGSYDSDKGRYNIRCLFGGNNKAAMDNLSYVHIRAGSIGYAYGGGNEGDMDNSRSWRDAYYQQPTPENATVLNLEDSVEAKFTGWIYDMPQVFGSMINASRAARVIVENIYGGCRKANVEYSSGVALSGGIYGYVQGGCDISGDVGSRHWGEGTWSIIEENAIVMQDVYGGSDGYYHCHLDGRYTSEDVLDYNLEPYDFYHDHVGLPIPTLNNSNLYIHGGVINFSAYGGGVMCDIGFKAGSSPKLYVGGVEQPLTIGLPQGETDGTQKGAIHFQINGGTIGNPYWHQNAVLLDGETNVTAAALRTKRAAAKRAGELANNDGNAYGGGYLSSLYGLSYFMIASDTTNADNTKWLHPRIYGSVFAGNDCMGSIASFGRYKLPNGTYEGFTASNGMQVNGSSKAVYDAYVRLEGYPRIACVYGSGNGAYNYHKPDRPEYSDMEPVCQDNMVDNRPFQSSTLIDIYTKGGFIDTVFGGGNGVGVNLDAMVLLNTQSKYNINHPQSRADSLFVGTIFGGNNRDDMTQCVPDIVLVQGTVRDVYGGGNAGSMSGYDNDITDVCGNPVPKVSAYVKVETDKVHVAGSIFGGCRMADVAGMTYVDIRSTDETGINYVYGGNDVSGRITGNTRVDVSGGYVNHIYGGSNGYYDYVKLTDKQGNDSIVVWTLDATPSVGDPTDLNIVALNSTGSPYVDETLVNLFGGTIRSSVYGGGRLGDCRNTTVVVNDRKCYMAKVDDPATTDVDESSTYRKLYINGEVYGGGEGLWNQLHLTHRGNTGENTTGMATGSSAVGASTVHLHHAESLTNAKAYGGGRGGDAYNTYVYLYDTWDSPFEAIYGGCWGSDVRGTTHVVLEGVTQSATTVDKTIMTAKNVFGGNDLTGNVYASIIDINSGTYGNIYGAGDGHGGSDKEEDEYGITDYGTYAKYYVGGSASTTYGTGLRVPNTEYITVNFNDGRVTGNVYGGGKLGTTFSYMKNAAGHYVTLNGSGDTVLVDIARNAMADTSQTAATTYADPKKYSYIITNIHGGTIDQNVFGGGSGVLNGNPIVYGLKAVYMDGGHIGQSLYGGSANVSDGYWHECRNATETSVRPSSIVNYSGGTVIAHVFGCGYMGITRGSSYVNVGTDAIDKSPLWTATIGGTENAYAAFKPGATDGYVAAMNTAELTIGQSVYGGPNWGNSSGSANFTSPGIYGGRTHIFIDGNNYNTGVPGDESKPVMNILDGSVIGAGTSAAGGDVNNRIDIRNYGNLNSDCVPTRSLKAIQRTDELWLNNTVIEYTGSTDAISAYMSNQLTLNRIETLNTVGYNIIYVDYAVTNIGRANFWEAVPYPYSVLTPADRTDLSKCYTAAATCAACTPRDEPYDVCDQLSVLNRTTQAYTALLVNAGMNVDFSDAHGYSQLNGYAYLAAPKGTNAIVTARSKYGNTNSTDGGFMTACADSLQAITGHTAAGEWDLTWCNCVRSSETESHDLSDPAQSTTSSCFQNGNYIAEYPYYNYSTTYRVWSLGNGTRRRFAVLQAHSTTANSEGQDKMITLKYPTNDSVYNLCIAHSTLKLPPTNPGNYYKINPTYGIELNDENEEMRLTDQSFKPTVAWDKTAAQGGLYDNWAIPTATPRLLYNSLTQTQKDSVNGEAAHGRMETLGVSNGTPVGINAIYNNPNTNFGLMMVSGKNFAKELVGGASDSSLVPPDAYASSATWTGSTTISGNNFVNTLGNFTTAKVGAAANASPELDLYLLYDNRFSHTMLGTVSLVLDEYEWIPGRTGGHGTEDTPGYIPAGRLYTIVNGDTVVIADANDNYLSGYSAADRHFVEHDLGMPIDVEISIATILEDFSDLEYEVLAMYNEGRYNQFTRKLVLPATLQNRELRLMGITWAPTTDNGAWLPGPEGTMGPKKFHMTDDVEHTILGAAPSENNRFAMKISVTDNISNNLTSSVGWYTKTVTTPTDLFTMTGATSGDTLRVSGGHANTNNYYVDGTAGHTAIPSAAIADGGTLLGVLDGRGEAAINLDFFFDGRRIYPKTAGKGYVGKVVLHMKSINTTGTHHENTFDITIFVKTRAHGDTIYLASAPTIYRNGITLHPHSGAPGALDGKLPTDYLRTFYDAFTGPYKEGDVIAILDEVTIPTGTAVFIKGLEHVPVPVIRYSGHHHSFPGENCAYRGPMITVSGKDAVFTARCIEFNGSALTKTKPKITNGDTWIANSAYTAAAYPNAKFDGLDSTVWKAAHTVVLDDYKVEDDGSGGYDITLVKDKYADTLKAFGPIIRVKDGGTVVLQNGTTVNRNYNIHDSTDTPLVDDPSLYGAISVTNKGTLQIINNVTIKENLSKSLGDKPEHPLNGAIYVDGGILELPAWVNTDTKIEVQQNLLVKNATTPFWETESIRIIDLIDDEEPVHYGFVGSSIFTDKNRILAAQKSNFGLANVLLTRKGTVPMSDTQTDVIHSAKSPTATTKIGISKWFPGGAEEAAAEDKMVRDTIQIVSQTTSTMLHNAVYNNENFTSDDDHFVFYNYGVNTQTVYLQRCATFKFQEGNGSSTYYVAHTPTALETNLLLDSVLDYVPRLDARCPTGGDSIVCRTQGGFFPYTFTWTDGDNGAGNELRAYTTPYTTIETNTQSEAQRTASAGERDFSALRATLYDSLFVPAVAMSHTETEKDVTYSVTVNDVTGNCRIKKNIHVKLVKDISGGTVTPFVKYQTDAAEKARWADTANPGNAALGIRTYEAIQIEPVVWSDRSLGTIAARIVSGEPEHTDSIYTEDANGHNPIAGMSFCEGDVILLSTSPRYTEDGSGNKTYLSKFVMWDFSPYYSNPVAFVVPPYSTQVVAYYKPLDYWKDVVDNTEKGGVAESNSYIYNSRPSVNSYTLENGGSSTEAGYVTTYHGDVHIYNENGLAWFISVVNGINGTQARSFYFNNVYLHQKDGGYDMRKHLWTPVGTLQHRFRGGFIGVKSGDTSTERDDEPVVIKSIVVDEPDLEHTGFFAFLDSAVVDNIQLQGELVRGAQYVGGLAAKSEHSKIINTKVLNSTEPVAPYGEGGNGNSNPSLTILTTHHTSGGLIGQSDHDSISNCEVAVKYVGDAVYNGGVVGYGTASRIYNNGTMNVNRMNAVYTGGVAGYLDGRPVDTHLMKKKRHAKANDEDGRSYVMNNYVRFDNEGQNQRVGGLAGYAKHTVFENNYLYGQLGGESTEGGVAAILDSSATAMHNYYENSATSKSVGQLRANASSTYTSDFSGKGNQVILSTRTYGVDNLTRALNIWVRAKGSNFKTWRSDLEGVNNGYPLFGTPDMIPVSEELTVTGCDSVEWDGQVFLFDDEVVSHIVDSVMMVDSTFTLRVLVNHATREQVEDSVNVGYGYEGHGFTLTDVEVLMLFRTVGHSHATTITLTDTLQSASGCDSIVTLMLTINPRVGIVEASTESKILVYPNPTTSRVTIEATDAMSHVELYDNRGSRLQDYNTHNNNDITIDVSQYPAGAYYLRVHTADHVTIQKLIKK